MSGEFFFWWAAKLELRLILSFLFAQLVWAAVVAIWLVSLPPPLPPWCLLSNQQWEWNTSLLEALQCLPTLFRVKAKVVQSSVWPSWCGPQLPLHLPLLPLSLGTRLQTQRPLMFLRPAYTLCARCSLRLEQSSPAVHIGFIPSFRSLLRGHPLIPTPSLTTFPSRLL